MDSNPSPARTASGFFNGIPGDMAYICSSEAPLNYNLVSSGWAECRTFTLHKTESALTPKLFFEDGSLVKCHGYIMGSWIGSEMCHEWTGVQLFVVDALLCPESSQQCYNFLLKSDTLNTDNQRAGKSHRRLIGQGKPLISNHESASYRATILLGWAQSDTVPIHGPASQLQLNLETQT